MKIVIVGCGRVGKNIAEQLSMENHDITVIDNDRRALSKVADTEGIMTVYGNGATIETQIEAGVKECDLVIAVTDNDVLNLYACLIAKTTGASRTIARVRNPEYSKDIPMIKDQLELSMAINPEYTSSQEMSRILKFPGAIEIDTFAKGAVDLIKIKVKDESILANQKVVDSCGLLKGNIRICVVERDGECYIPNGDFVIKSKDLVSVLVPSHYAGKTLKKLGLISKKGRSVFILGGSKIAYYLAKNIAALGMDVKIIEERIERCEELSESLDNVVIINGDAMDQDLLIAEGIQNADGIVTLMNSDEENILISLFAKNVNPDAKVITEINEFKFSTIVENLPLDTVVHPKFLTGEYIVRYVRAMQNSMGSNIETLYRIFNNKAEAMEFRVREDSLAIGVPLAMLDLKPELQVACINRHGKIIIPTGTDTMEIGDTVIIVTKQKGLSDLKDILK